MTEEIWKHPDLEKWFECIECEDTGMVWTSDPEFPNNMQMDMLVPCTCQIGAK